MDPVRELPYWPAAMVLLIEAGQMTASDYVPTYSNLLLASKGASTDAFRSARKRPLPEDIKSAFVRATRQRRIVAPETGLSTTNPASYREDGGDHGSGDAKQHWPDQKDHRDRISHRAKHEG